MEPKKWYESKTIWLNLFMGIAGVALGLEPALAEWLNEGVFSVVWSVAALFLRAKTDKPIEA
jgi:hypothetical protein